MEGMFHISSTVWSSFSFSGFTLAFLSYYFWVCLVDEKVLEIERDSNGLIASQKTQNPLDEIENNNIEYYGLKWLIFLFFIFKLKILNQGAY